MRFAAAIDFRELGWELCGYVICGFLSALAVAILVLIWQGKINLNRLISEPTGDASMSRFQLLIFTFVIAGGLFMIVAHDKKFPALDSSILTLLGISGSSYLVSKGIQFSNQAGINEKNPAVQIAPQSSRIPSTGKFMLKATVQQLADPAVRWEIVSGPGKIDPTTGEYDPTGAAPTTTPAATPAKTGDKVVIRAVSIADGTVTDLAHLDIV